MTTSSGLSVCPASPLGGTWDGATGTCSVTGTLTIPTGTTLDIGVGVTLDACPGAGCDIGISNNGVINNYGTMTGNSSSDTGADGIVNAGTINNYGSTTGNSNIAGGTGIGRGIFNQGTINNAHTLTGDANEYGFLNYGTINNYGTMIGLGGSSYYGIDNPIGAINDYCGAIPTAIPGFEGFPYNPISCYTVSFHQSGMPDAGVEWNVTVSWLFGSANYTGTGASIAVPKLVGPIIYFYGTPVAGSGTTYNCSSSDCSGATSVSADTTIVATYSQVASFGSEFSLLQKDLSGNFTGLSTGMSTLTGDLSADYSSLSSSLASLSASMTAGFSTVESELTTLSGSVTTGFSTVESELTGISTQLNSLQSTVSGLGNPPQVVTGSGVSTLNPSSESSTIFTSPSNQLGTVTLTLNTTGVGSHDTVTVRYYTDPGNSSLYFQQTIASKGDNPIFTTSVAAWKVQIVASFGSKAGSVSVNWAYSAIDPPS